MTAEAPLSSGFAVVELGCVAEYRAGRRLACLAWALVAEEWLGLCLWLQWLVGWLGFDCGMAGLAYRRLRPVVEAVIDQLSLID